MPEHTSETIAVIVALLAIAGVLTPAARWLWKASREYANRDTLDEGLVKATEEIAAKAASNAAALEDHKRESGERWHRHELSTQERWHQHERDHPRSEGQAASSSTWPRSN